MSKKQFQGLPDEIILESYLRNQSEVYFSELYSRYIHKVYSKCIALLKEENLAEDATQEIFLKIFLNLAKFNQKSKFSTWIYSITYNYCIDLIRKQNKQKSVITEEKEQDLNIAEEIDDKQLLEMELSRLSKTLEQIPAQDKSVLMMKYQDDMSIKEIGEVLDKSESAVKMMIKRAKHKAFYTHQKLFVNDNYTEHGK